MDKVVSMEQVKEEMCQVCHKRKATKLCDRIIRHWKWAGHTPMHWEKDESTGTMYRAYEKGPISGTDTCDMKLCDQCATFVIGMDLCPRCLRELKQELGIK